MAEELLQIDYSNAPNTVMPLKTRVVRSGLWVFALRVANYLFGFIRTVILARFLAPSDFGLFGIALLAMSILEVFSQTGLNTALIRRKDDIRPYLDTVWTVQVFRGAVLALIAFIASPYIAAFFKTPAAGPILQAVALSNLIGGFTNVGVIYFQRELEFHRLFAYQLTCIIVDVGVTASLAVILRSVWALALGLLAGSFVQVVLSYFVHPYRPRPGFNKHQFKELFVFGRWISVSNILIFIAEHGDDVLLAKVLGPTVLGLYQMAYRISNLPATEILGSVSQVLLPAYSKLQNYPEKIRSAYLRVLSTTAFIAMPLAGGIFLMAPEFTHLVLGGKWMPMVPTMQVLVLFVVLRCFGWASGPIFEAVGRPDILTKVGLIHVLIFAGIVYPLTIRLGMLGTAISVVIPMVISQTISAMKIVSLIRLRFVELVQSFFLPLGLAILMVMISMPFKKYLSVNLISFVSIVVMAGLIYLGETYILNYSIFNEFYSLIKRYYQ